MPFILCGLIFVGALVAGRDWPGSTRLFPTVISVAGILLAVLAIVDTIRRPRAPRVDRAADGFGGSTKWRGYRFIAWVLGMWGLVYLAGFSVGLGVSMFLYLLLEGRRPVWVCAAFTAAAGLCYYACFVLGLSLRLYPGVLF